MTAQTCSWRVDYWHGGMWVKGCRFTTEERATLHARSLMTDKPGFVGVEKTRINLRNKIQYVLKKEKHDVR